VTIRLNVSPKSGNNASAACEVRSDNVKLTIVSQVPASGRRSQTIVTWNVNRGCLSGCGR
jgi:hypothetical protein